MPELRLVCRRLDALLKEMVAQTLRICYYSQISGKIEEIVSRPNAFSCPFESLEIVDPRQPMERQWDWHLVATLVRKMIGVRTVM